LPVWLSDQSDDKATARAFLDARIENVMSFEKLKWRVKSVTKNMPEPAEILGQLRYGGLDFLSRPKKGCAQTTLFALISLQRSMPNAICQIRKDF
jgi:ubiquinone biosynthesis protein COQ9